MTKSQEPDPKTKELFALLRLDPATQQEMVRLASVRGVTARAEVCAHLRLDSLTSEAMEESDAKLA